MSHVDVYSQSEAPFSYDIGMCPADLLLRMTYPTLIAHTNYDSDTILDSPADN